MSSDRFVAHLNHQAMRAVAPDVQPMLVEWWNVSRMQKHGSRAVWSEMAFTFSVRRVALLPPWKQQVLAEAGIEHGWQALKPEYIKDATAPASSGLAPKSSAMQEAITAWNNQAS